MLNRKPFINSRHFWYWLAWALWLIPILVMAGMIAAHPLYRSMTPSYHEAVANWWAHQPVYTGPGGFNYLPSFLLCFSFVAWLPLAVAEILWRWVAFVGLGFGLWHCCGLMTYTKNRYRNFVVVTLLVLPICMSALRNRQSSAHLAACLVLTAWCLHKERWWWSTLWLCLALVCKPLGIVAIGLAVIAFPKLRLRAAFGTVIVLVCPYFFAPAIYVNELYVEFAKNLMACFDTGERAFADLNGVLSIFDIKLQGMSSLIVRATAGGATATVIWFAAAGHGADMRRVLLWLGLTASYIMLFTPMNEANSYVMLAPALGLWAWWHIAQGATRIFKIIVAMSLTILLLPDFVGLLLGKDNGNQFANFWNPFMTLAFFAILLRQVRVLSVKDRANILSVGALVE